MLNSEFSVSVDWVHGRRKWEISCDDERIQREALFWAHDGDWPLRVGNWIQVPGGRRQPYELCDLETDRTETKDLADTHPERADELGAMWDAWAKWVTTRNSRCEPSIIGVCDECIRY